MVGFAKIVKGRKMFDRRTFLKATGATLIAPSLFVAGKSGPPKLAWKSLQKEIFYMKDIALVADLRNKKPNVKWGTVPIHVSKPPGKFSHSMITVSVYRTIWIDENKVWTSRDGMQGRCVGVDYWSPWEADIIRRKEDNIFWINLKDILNYPLIKMADRTPRNKKYVILRTEQANGCFTLSIAWFSGLIPVQSVLKNISWYELPEFPKG